MKKYLYSSIGLLLLIASCKKSELTLYPYNQVETSQAFNAETDVTLAVNGIYQGITQSGSYYNGAWNIIPDILADNLIINQSGRLTNKVYGEWRYTANGTYPLFGAGYTIIRRANAVLENIDRFNAGAFRDNAKGEALAIRAMTYFDMSRVYSKTYANASATDLTVPYVTTTDPTILPASEPVKGFYDKVIADLTLAGTLVGTTNGIYRFNKNSVNAILSRVYLYKGDYANAIAAATAALGATPAIGDLTTFPRIWTDESNVGVLLKVANTALDNINTLGTNYYQIVGGQIKSEYVVDYNLAQLFTSTDIRRSAYITTSVYNGVNYNHVIKYNGRPAGAAGVVDGKIIRSAEVLLNRAEAYFNSGNEGAALTDLRLLKRNRYAGYVDETISGAALLNEILKQRRLELAFEGHRFFDLKRLNLPVVRDITKGEKADGSGTTYVFGTLAAGDPRFQLPLPQGEITFNPNIKQNPGY
jgi:tetratricopeptide (TPR) repeat protein